MKIILLLCALALSTCQAPNPHTEQGHEPVVYGNDDRYDAYAYPDQTWAAQAQDSTLAFFSNDYPGPIVSLEDAGLCADERFAEQPVGAICSGTLIDSDLVLTAGHCVRDHISGTNTCSSAFLVFNYVMEDANTLRDFTAEDVYQCQEVLAYQESYDPLVLDYAIVRLDRPAVGHVPAVVRAAPTALSVGDALIMHGFPEGIPLKIEDGGWVRDPRADQLDYFFANTDSFSGNSGSGVFLAQSGELAGILVRGDQDYVWDESAQCSRVNVCPNDGCNGEELTYAFRAIEDLCAQGIASALCPCGDGTCDSAGGEDTVSCPLDCGTDCGDGACNGDETALNCELDCTACGNGVCEAEESATGNCCDDCGCGAFEVCHSSHVCVPDLSRGDTCADAVPIEASDSRSYPGRTSDASDDNQGSCTEGTKGQDRVYTFVLAAEANLAAEVTGIDSVLYLRSICTDAGSEIACNDDVDYPENPHSEFGPLTLAAGSYFLIVDSYNENTAGDYTLTVSFSCADSDLDGSCNDVDNCPSDPNKTDPLVCGCGVPDMDTDQDGSLDCLDDCPTDSDKQAPGICGCGVSDVDTDLDGTADCEDACPDDSTKTEPQVCGCGMPEDATDSDGDGVVDCVDACPLDPDKVELGQCGCGQADTDSDGDLSADCIDACPDDPAKIVPGGCGCGELDTDTDIDGSPDCHDRCPEDAEKIEAGDCGCGQVDSDGDGDGTADCNDGCPADADKIAPGQCGCAQAELDSDSDGSADCVDACPDDADKTEPLSCGCGQAEASPCTEEPQPESGCGCQSSQGPEGVYFGLLLLGLLATRRRAATVRARHRSSADSRT